MKTFKEFIQESARATVYHATQHENASTILKKGKIESSPETGHTSTTRDRGYAKEFGDTHFHIDHNKVRHNQKTRPTDWHMGGSIKNTGRHDDWARDPDSRRSESEEAVKGHISMKHVTHVSVHKDVPQSEFRKISLAAQKHPHIKVQRYDHKGFKAY